jgi:hypothetical protein
MTNTPQDSSRSVQIGTGNEAITGSAIVAGDGNTVSVQFQSERLPDSNTVDIQAELEALQAILASINHPIVKGVAEQLEVEAKKPELDKSKISEALETGIKHSKELSDFAENIDKLRPHVEATASWLGKYGTKLLPLIGFTL